VGKLIDHIASAYSSAAAVIKTYVVLLHRLICHLAALAGFAILIRTDQAAPNGGPTLPTLPQPSVLINDHERRP
jgi:hypothetical protein